MTDAINLAAVQDSITGAIAGTLSGTIPGTISGTLPGTLALSHPEWLWLLPVLLLATLLWRRFGRLQSSASLATGQSVARQRVIHPLIALLPHGPASHRTPLTEVLIYSGIILGLVISLAEPVRIGSRLPDPPQERDIVFIVDTSISMTLKDYVLDGQRIDRMTLLKGVLDRFIQQLPGERIGIIIFADAAYTFVPLTRDQSLLRRMLSRLQATMVGRFNNMGEAIALAVKQTQQQASGHRHRVLVMLTDADRPTGSIDPHTAAALADEAGLPLYTIAIGASTAEAEEQRTTGLIYEPVDRGLLDAISTRTGARSYQAGDAQALENAVNDIANSEANLREVAPRYYRAPLYHWPLLVSVGLLCGLLFSAHLKALLLALRPGTGDATGDTRP
ncbi:MAG: VWA domain-containing protein [Gammaproteobacteria bacterium]|nr:VWA domain-containing protein [Gammaproteobacteria bacterium]